MPHHQHSTSPTCESATDTGPPQEPHTHLCHTHGTPLSKSATFSCKSAPSVANRRLLGFRSLWNIPAGNMTHLSPLGQLRIVPTCIAHVTCLEQAVHGCLWVVKPADGHVCKGLDPSMHIYLTACCPGPTLCYATVKTAWMSVSHVKVSKIP